jgi:hypothetical protein
MLNWNMTKFRVHFEVEERRSNLTALNLQQSDFDNNVKSLGNLSVKMRLPRDVATIN